MTADEICGLRVFYVLVYTYVFKGKFTVNMNKKLIVAALLVGISIGVAQATGMLPETTVVIINAADGGGSINVKNTNAGPELLYTSIYDIKEQKGGVHVIPTQPIVRVEPGKTQQVRFVLTSPESVKVQQLKRVVFEGIPQREPGANKLNFTVRQDLPLIIHPKGLPDVSDPWKLLKWTQKNGRLVVDNSSPYVVRLSQKIVLLPSNAIGTLKNTYILPGELVTIEFGPDVNLDANTHIKFTPATQYGFQASDNTATIEK